ncbi:MAG: hypothetical protein CMJ25_32215 [Phycisphaerae bacterium]|nr:hypothetical protein [Phycisphaerae bacterium]
MSLGSILGGIAGLLIPGGGALYSAIGSGLGGLIIDKKKPKDAIKDALIAGVGAKVFGPAIQGGLGSLGLGTQAGAQQLATQQAATQAIQGTTQANLLAQGSQKVAEKGIMDKVFGGNPMMLYTGLTALGAVEELTKPQSGLNQELYVDRYTGRRFSTPEARDEFEEVFRRKHQFEYPDGLPPRSEGFAQGGYIEGPGTGRSDSIPATIYQDGQPVQDAALSDGEFVMTERAVKGAGNGNREQGAAKMYAMMRDFERGAA